MDGRQALRRLAGLPTLAVDGMLGAAVAGVQLLLLALGSSQAADHRLVARLVARLEGRVVGWTALAPVSDRCAYAGVAEDSIYVAPEAQGHGGGRALLAAVVASAEQGGIWTVQTGIFPENQAGVRLHRACGFRLVGVRERLGRLGDRWRDVLLLERRSPVIA